MHPEGKQANSEGTGLRAEELPQGVEQGATAVFWLRSEQGSN